MKKSILILLLFAFSSQVFSQETKIKESQETKLDEVVITAVNYKYLNAVDSEKNAVNVQELEEKVAMHNIKDSELYNDEYDTYYITFFIPDGKILAAYDKDGKLIRTIERFKNIKLPNKVRDAIAKRFPNWSMVKDIYKVNYHEGVVKKQYKVKLEKGDETKRVKLDENGNFQ